MSLRTGIRKNDIGIWYREYDMVKERTSITFQYKTTIKLFKVARNCPEPMCFGTSLVGWKLLSFNFVSVFNRFLLQIFVKCFLGCLCEFFRTSDDRNELRISRKENRLAGNLYFELRVTWRTDLFTLPYIAFHIN